MECFIIVNFLVKNSKMHRSLKPDLLANTDTLDQGFFFEISYCQSRENLRERESERKLETKTLKGGFFISNNFLSGYLQNSVLVIGYSCIRMHFEYFLSRSKIKRIGRFAWNKDKWSLFIFCLVKFIATFIIFNALVIV